MTEVDDFLEHYGVKGMRWGVRRSASELARGSSSESTTKKSNRPAWQSPPSKAKSAMDKPVKLSRKESRRAKKQKELSKDAIEFNSLKQKVKKNGLESLTNDDLKKINQRMELQQKYSKAFPKKKNPFVEILVEGVLSEVGTTAVSAAIAKGDPIKTAKIKTAIELGRVARAATKKK